MKRAFSLLVAIAFIVIIASLGAISISMTGENVQKENDLYLVKQAQLLGRSATEYAILATQGHDFSTSCLNAININYNDTFDINITIAYIGSDLPSNCRILANNIQTEDSNGTAIIDVRVSLNPTLLDANPPITFVRRTLQKL